MSSGVCFAGVEQRDANQEDECKGFGEVLFGSAHSTPGACAVSAAVIFCISFSGVCSPCYWLCIFSQ